MLLSEAREPLRPDPWRNFFRLPVRLGGLAPDLVEGGAPERVEATDAVRSEGVDLISCRHDMMRSEGACVDVVDASERVDRLFWRPVGRRDSDNCLGSLRRCLAAQS